MEQSKGPSRTAGKNVSPLPVRASPSPEQPSSPARAADVDCGSGLDELEAPAPSPNAGQNERLRLSLESESPNAVQAQEDGDPELSQETSGLDELAAPAPDQNVDEAALPNSSLESELPDPVKAQDNGDTELSQETSGLDELAAPPPDQNVDEGALYRRNTLEDQRDKDAERRRSASAQPPPSAREFRARFLEQTYIVSYLILFSILGVLARLGLQALTLYPGALVSNTDIWANVGGSFFMGFLREDRMLFRRHWNAAVEKSSKNTSDAGSHDHSAHDEEKSNPSAEAQTAFKASKVSIPGYIGLAVGFCGSFTSFASVNRDAFLAISDNLDTATVSTYHVTTDPRSRSAGYSVMAVIAVLFMEVSMSLIALKSGAHLATVVGRLAERLPVLGVERIMNPLVVVVGWGAWIGTVMLAIWAPHDKWRGEVVFAIVFAPVGCLLRFILSIKLNRKVRSFPLGTFTANILGTCVLGMSYDLQHSSAARSVVGCQVLQGIEDGFCGALTTVSTWVLELDTLRLHHAYFYGACSLFVATGLITAIMGSLRWTEGFTSPICSA
ncbi:hypothetical protein LTR36_009010 [Oleoguttula mirabilis]|uniref:CrcB-like protein n=1 Tax=Oleoguttula mirabilis TaxID=1507867 RepID=A0AAV9J6Q1_9PEZI|nr:hypothetical protein LTR36_009010 [Oleoguttula mirabilis]